LYLTIALQTTAGPFAKISNMRSGQSLLNSNGVQGLFLQSFSHYEGETLGGMSSH